ncbi:universal stress protein [Paraburkholderia sp. CNPSo 3274]|uniref:universal stress protein n=1 Tax=Paraburkholderia sp. CNPSo 3274 TaxID=2940932 RepID=UPI0020B7C91A|nr:universal stress protein [Paraburkholderia sp. CNPSo 3274]MCP3711393.1 universal stress protein [Paraburkholderia sp. CNPSo 3274]
MVWKSSAATGSRKPPRRLRRKRKRNKTRPHPASPGGGFYATTTGGVSTDRPGNLAVVQHFCAGNPADVVVEQARLLNAEVIVMGHHHLSRLRRLTNPST